ncbi:MAG: KAP family NTPase [Oscillospiraceae bacterium]|nr:KAP family NTPase [Oscillospiraceae bacterium]
MTTLEELVDYCDEEKPVGALLLTGEWGCGKTYFIEHELKERVKKNAVILRVSLFGMTSVDEINEAVKKAWIELYSGFAHSLFDEKSKVRQILNAISSADNAPGGLKALISIDYTAFIPLKNKIITNEKGKDKLEKKVILVFDDLERCNMDYADVLGVINDYCENKEFHTIIVANEDIIKSKDNTPKTENAPVDDANTTTNKSIPYSELKEKIIGRSIKYTPDYKNIVHAVIETFLTVYKENRYYLFLTTYEEEIINLFAPSTYHKIADNDQLTQSPHNIRSLKCALYDFHRIYKLLIARFPQDDTTKKFLFNFIPYVLAIKSNHANNEEVIKNYYPSFERGYLFKSEKEWVDNGYWNEDDFNHEIDMMIERNTKNPLKILKFSNIMYIEDDIVQEYFSQLLECAYNGELSLDEYVYLIGNSSTSRLNKLKLPAEIDWDKVNQGISLQFDKLSSSSSRPRFLYTSLENKIPDDYTPEELTLYKKIRDFVRNGGETYEVNRKRYIEEMKSYTEITFHHLKNKLFVVFDLEMADATFQAYKDVNNYEKAYFNSTFNTMWESILDRQQDFNYLDSRNGFDHLIRSLTEYMRELDNEHKQIAVFHVNNFITTVDKLLKKTNEMLSSEKENNNQSENS